MSDEAKEENEDRLRAEVAALRELLRSRPATEKRASELIAEEDTLRRLREAPERSQEAVAKQMSELLKELQ